MSFPAKARKARDKGKIVVLYTDNGEYLASVKNVVVFEEGEKVGVRTGKAFDRYLDEAEIDEGEED